MEELFAVDTTTLFVLVGVLVLVIFIVIYKSKQQNSTTYHTDEKAHNEEVKKIEKIVKTKEKKSPTFAEMEKETEFYIDWASIFAFSLMLQLSVIQEIGVFDSPEKNFALSFAIMIALYFVVIKPIIRWMDL